MILYYPQALPLFQNSAPRILTPYFCAVVLIQFVVGQWDVSVNEQSIAWMHPRTRAPWRCCFVVNRLAVTAVTDFFFDKRPLSDSLQAMVPFQYLCTCSSSIFGRVMTSRSIRRRVWSGWVACVPDGSLIPHQRKRNGNAMVIRIQTILFENSRASQIREQW